VILQETQVVRLGSGLSKIEPLDPTLLDALGRPPLRLLWESSRDAIIVVANAGVQVLDGPSPGTYLRPCGDAPVDILDAT